MTHPAPFKIGLIGCGVVASYGHLPAIRATPSLELHALCDLDPQRLAQQADQFHPCHRFADPEAFFASGLDAVVVTSPAPVHRQNVLDAARRGLPVLCEKPLAMDAEEALEMIDAMRRANAMLAVAFCYRYSPCALEMKRRIADGDIGQPGALRLIYNWACGGKYPHDDPGVDPAAWSADQRRRDRMLEGGPMVDCGTHQIDLARWWLGSEVADVSGHGAWFEDYEAPVHVWAHLNHDNGVHTAVEMSFAYGHTARDRRPRFSYEVIGTEGVLHYDREAERFELRNGRGSTDLPFHPEKNFAGMYAAWSESLQRGHLGDELCSGADALRITDIARMATNCAVARRATTTPILSPALPVGAGA